MGEQYPYPVMPTKVEALDFAREHPFATVALAGLASVVGWIAGSKLAETIAVSSKWHLVEVGTSPEVPGLY